MAAVAAASQSEPEPTPTPAPACPRAALDPQLFMAARRGDRKLLKDLLQLKDDDEEEEEEGEQATRNRIPNATDAGTSVEAAAAQQVSIDVEVDRHSGAPPPPPPPATAPALASASSSPSSPVPVLDEDGVTMEGDSLLHVVAACGDTLEYLRCAKMIVRNKEKKGGAGAKRRALEVRNSKGDTPLHCAAAAGNANMISCLVDLLANTDEATAPAVKAWVRTQNECGETALHQAVRAAANKVACIDHLMDVDPKLACIPHQEEDDAGASPLYLAISLGEVEVARHLYVKSKGNLSYSGPHGRNVLHAAVHRGQALSMILEWLIKGMKPKEDGPAKHCAANVHGDRHMHTSRTSMNSSVSLVSQLTGQRDKKQKGSAPLHLAASLGGSRSATELLLDANESTAYQADDEGSYPIHVAAACDKLGVVKVLLDDMDRHRCRRQDCATLRDGKGRTFLHVAAEKKHSGGSAVVQYVCGEMPQQLSFMILNAQDSNGDTALHGAVRAGNLDVSTCLLRNRWVRLDVANKDGMTPLDLSWTTIPAGFNYGLNPRNVVHLSLLYSGAQFGGGRPHLFRDKYRSKADLVEESKKFTETTQVTSIVTALIATVTFASAFTLPGGYRSDDSGAAAGTAVLAGKKSYAFDAFILADTLSFIFSLSATCTLVYAGSPALDLSTRGYYYNVSAFSLLSAARSLVAAFGLALYLVLAPVDHKTAVAVCAIVFATSLYGNMGALEVIRVANTARTRIGMRRLVVCSFATVMSFGALVHFGSYIIIFGLPAILKLAR